MIIEVTSTTLYSIYQRNVNDEDEIWEVKFRHQNKSIIDHHMAELRQVNGDSGFLYRIVANKETLCKNTETKEKYTRIVDTVIESDIPNEVNLIISESTLS